MAPDILRQEACVPSAICRTSLKRMLILHIKGGGRKLEEELAPLYIAIYIAPHTSCGVAAKPAWNLYLYTDAGKGFAPLSFGHEPKMFLLHQPALLRTFAADDFVVHLKVKAHDEVVCSRIYSHKAKVTWTLIITVMSSTLYQLSYSLNKKNDGAGHTYVGLYI